MDGENSSLQRSRSTTASSSRPASVPTPTLTDDYSIRRMAINPSAALGSFYNANTDSILNDKLLLGKTPITKTASYKPVICTTMTDDTFNGDDLLHKIGIYDELWLNLVLNIVRAEGMASLITYSFPKTPNTRFLYYSYTSEERAISQHHNVVRKEIPKEPPVITATHIISAIEVGIQVFIVLELSSHDQSNLDLLLEKIKEQLIRNKYEFSRNEMPLLNGIQVIEVFSNISDLERLSKLDDICRRIMEIKSHTYRHGSLNYTLRPIWSFYPTYSKEKAKYISLEPSTTSMIKQYLFSLSSNNEVDMILKQSLSRCFTEVQFLIKEIQETRPDEIKWLHGLVLKIRNGIVQQGQIAELLTNRLIETLSKHVDVTPNCMASTAEREVPINNREQQDARYMDYQPPVTQKENDQNTSIRTPMKDNDLETNSSLNISPRKVNLFTYNNMEETGTPSTINNDDSDMYNSLLNAPEATILLPKQSCKIEQTSEPPKSLPPLTSDAAQASSTQVSNSKQSESPSESEKLSITAKSSTQERQRIDMNEQTSPRQALVVSPSDINFLKHQQNEDSKTVQNTSVTPRPSTIENTSLQSDHSINVGEQDTMSNSQTASRPIPSPRKHKRPVGAEQISRSLESLSQPTKKRRAVLNERPNNMEKQFDATKSSLTSPSPIIPRAKQQVPDSKESPSSSRPSKPYTADSISHTEKHSYSVDGHASRSEAASIAPLLRTEKQRGDTKETSEQLKSPVQALQKSSSLPAEQSHDEKQQTDTSRSSKTLHPQPTPRDRRRSRRSTAINDTNILLLGESGVSKSTFINALLNYHTFKTFEQAQTNRPLVLMPVSFLVTVGDSFEEKIIRFGDADSNEDHDHSSQSVTQHCRSYVFPFDSQTRLRIIDTPGMGDTRGLDQDDLNIQHILSFINNLPHLNAICILLKPNESRLNVVLRSYFTRLLHFLGENARHNIVFCFTNTRSTFYAPGDTAPLLRDMLNKAPIKDIPFKKSNTFCFDSKSLRYLIALHHGIEFDNFYRAESMKSWRVSVTESDRLLQYICRELKSYTQNEWHSIEHAQYKITEIIRPMLETTRNLGRNITSLQAKFSTKLIKLRATALSEPSFICYQCKRIPERFGNFWIRPDNLHVLSNKSNCLQHKHIVVNYELDYEAFDHSGAQSFNEMESGFKQLRLTLLEFAQFYASDIEEVDEPVLSALKRMVDEEDQICSEKDADCFNPTLRDMLTTLVKTYKERQKTSRSIQLPIDLSNVYEHIKCISLITEVSEQLNAIRQTHEAYVKQQEKHVS